MKNTESAATITQSTGSAPFQCFKMARVRFDELGQDEVLRLIKEGTADPFWYVTTPNVDHVVRADESKTVRKLYDASTVTVCDSRVLRLLCRLIYGRVISVLPGSDLTASLLNDLRSNRSFKITIVGCDSAQIECLISDYDLARVAHKNPPYGFVKSLSEIKSVVRWVEQQEPSVIFFALGSPQQEVLAYLLRRRGKTRGAGLCVGASIDFLTGKERRAPVFFQKASLEWLYRLARNPRRMAHRYLVRNPRIAAILLRDRFSQNPVPISAHLSATQPVSLNKQPGPKHG